MLYKLYILLNAVEPLGAAPTLQSPSPPTITPWALVYVPLN